MPNASGTAPSAAADVRPRAAKQSTAGPRRPLAAPAPPVVNTTGDRSECLSWAWIDPSDDSRAERPQVAHRAIAGVPASSLSLAAGPRTAAATRAVIPAAALAIAAAAIGASASGCGCRRPGLRATSGRLGRPGTAASATSRAVACAAVGALAAAAIRTILAAAGLTIAAAAFLAAALAALAAAAARSIRNSGRGDRGSAVRRTTRLLAGQVGRLEPERCKQDQTDHEDSP